MRQKQKFSLCRRGKIWFFYYYDNLGNRKRRSTGETSKTVAYEVARRYVKSLEDGQKEFQIVSVPPPPRPGMVLHWVEPPPKTSGYRLAWVPVVVTPTLAEYAKDWFTGKGPYELRKQAEGKPLTEGTLELHRLILTRHLIPRVGHLKLDEITTARIERLKLELYEETKKPDSKIKSGIRVNQILGTLRLILKNAIHEGLLSSNPFTEVKPVHQTTRRKRRLLSPSEAQQLLNPSTVASIWGTSEIAKASWLATLIAAFTGARRNEVLGLEWDRVHLETNPPYIVIDRQLSRDKTHTVPTKAKDARTPPLPSFLVAILQSLPRPCRWVISANGKPLDTQALRYNHQRALERLGITPEEQQQRGLTFHSWRAWFNTTLRPIVNETDLRRVIGHKSVEMTNLYDNPDIASLAPVAQALERIWGN